MSEQNKPATVPSVDDVVNRHDELIDVWEVWPHLNTDFDYAVFDEHTRAIEYAGEVVAAFIDEAGDGDEMPMKIKHTSMTRHDFEECLGD